jgi:hypothetical protein
MPAKQERQASVMREARAEVEVEVERAERAERAPREWEEPS